MKSLVFLLVTFGLHVAHAQIALLPAGAPSRTIEIRKPVAQKPSAQKPTNAANQDILVTARTNHTNEPTKVTPVPAPIPVLPPLDFTPPEPHPLTSEELRTMYDEMLALNKISYADFKPRLRRAKYLQYTYEFSANAKRREKEIKVYLELTLRAIKVDQSAESLQYFHNVYDLYKADFDTAMAKMSPKKRADLYAADDEAKRLLDSDRQDDGNE